MILQKKSNGIWQEEDSWYSLDDTLEQIDDETVGHRVEECVDGNIYRWSVRACDGERNCSGWSVWLYLSTYF